MCCEERQSSKVKASGVVGHFHKKYPPSIQHENGGLDGGKPFMPPRLTCLPFQLALKCSHSVPLGLMGMVVWWSACFVQWVSDAPSLLSLPSLACRRGLIALEGLRFGRLEMWGWDGRRRSRDESGRGASHLTNYPQPLDEKVPTVGLSWTRRAPLKCDIALGIMKDHERTRSCSQ